MFSERVTSLAAEFYAVWRNKRCNCIEEDKGQRPFKYIDMIGRDTQHEIEDQGRYQRGVIRIFRAQIKTVSSSVYMKIL